MDFILAVVKLPVRSNVVATHHRKDATVMAVALLGSPGRIQNLCPVLGLHNALGVAIPLHLMTSCEREIL